MSIGSVDALAAFTAALGSARQVPGYFGSADCGSDMAWHPFHSVQRSLNVFELWASDARLKMGKLQFGVAPPSVLGCIGSPSAALAGQRLISV
jgi:hypothetical protein